MAAVRSIGPRASGSGSNSNQSSYFIAAVAIIFALVILRVLILRWHNQKMSDFFRIHGNPLYSDSSPPNNSNYNSLYRGMPLTPLPAAYHPDRRVRAADIDAQGRRTGPAGEGLDGKDALPAYDSLDRPPKYIEAGWSHGPHHPMEQPAAVSPPEGAQSGTAHPNTSVPPAGNMGHLAADTCANPQSHHDLSSS